MPTSYGPKCVTCGHPTRMLVGREWRDIPCDCPDTPGTPPYRHVGPGQAPWAKPDNTHHEVIRKPPLARLVRDKMAAARAKVQGQGR